MSKAALRIVIFGAGQNGAQAFHILKHDPAIEVAGFLDDAHDRHGQSYFGRPIFGGADVLPQLRREQDIQGGIVAIGDNAARARLDAELRAAGLLIVNAIHPRALIDHPSHLGEGLIIEMGAGIHPEVELGNGVFVGGNAVVSHHSRVGEFSLIGGGAMFGGCITIGRQTLIGVGVSIGPQLTIGDNVIVGVGAAVVKALPSNVVAVGVPAKVIRSRPPLR